ncbi:hypothetical protein HanIR_Chr07g0306201 [Helianthus annuus]|nr:hypothetical protein HanIR_Chr07g0306201 [Helianthus annuus]
MFDHELQVSQSQSDHRGTGCDLCAPIFSWSISTMVLFTVKVDLTVDLFIEVTTVVGLSIFRRLSSLTVVFDTSDTKEGRV